MNSDRYQRGLAKITEMEGEIGGTFYIWSKPQEGTKIHIIVPLRKRDSN